MEGGRGVGGSRDEEGTEGDREGGCRREERGRQGRREGRKGGRKKVGVRELEVRKVGGGGRE